MNRAGGLAALFILLVIEAAALWPFAWIVEAVFQPRTDRVSDHAASHILLTSMAWASAIVVGACVVGYVPGRALGSMRRTRWSPVLTALTLLPVIIPAYVVYYVWWRMLPPTSGVYVYAVHHGLVSQLKGMTLFVSLVLWSWPFIAWAAAMSVSNESSRHRELLRIDGAPWFMRLWYDIRSSSKELAFGSLIVFLLTLNNTTNFDLAGIFSIGNEIRAAEAQEGSLRDVLAVAAPVMIVNVIGACVIWLLFVCRRHEQNQTDTRGGAWTTAPLIGIAMLSVVPVVWVCTAGISIEELRKYFDFYTRQTGLTFVVAAVSACVCALLAVAFVLVWMTRSRPASILGQISTVILLVSALFPATAISMALESAYNRPSKEISFISSLLRNGIYDTPAIVIIADVARYGFIAAIMAWWAARAEPRALVELRSIDGVRSIGAMLAANRPRIRNAVLVTLAITFALSFSDVTVHTQVMPFRYELIAPTVLGAIHYQHWETAMAAVLVMLIVAGLVVGITIASMRFVSYVGMRRLASIVILCASVVALRGCGGASEPNSPLDTELTFGARGRSDGQFTYPRAIALSRELNRLYVVDKSARIQCFSVEGEYQFGWRMPAWDMGKPVGLNIAPDGRVFVADTHYHRVMIFDENGNFLSEFGSIGEGDGQFIFPTDVEFGADGTLYVSEYGGNDRISVFDAAGTFLYSFGSFGSDDGQFSRPQSMVFDHDRNELYIADACNHRIIVVDSSGTWIRTIGQAGTEPGSLSYPYDLTMLSDGSLMVSEFGANRVQRLASDGRCLGLYGRFGPGDGELQYPWGIESDDNLVYILDSGNDRVQVIDNPA